MLWAEYSEQSASTSLRVALHGLRKALIDAGIKEDIIESSKKIVRVKDKDYIVVDAHLFEETIKEAKSTRDDKKKIDLLIKATSIYKGEFLPEFDDDWCVSTRRYYADLYISALASLVEALAKKDLYKEALDYATRWYRADKYNEHLTKLIIELNYKLNQPDRAIEHFKTYSKLMMRDMDIEPSESVLKVMRSFGLKTTTSSEQDKTKSYETKKTKTIKQKNISKDPLVNANMQILLGKNLINTGDIDKAIEALSAALKTFEKSGNLRGAAQTHLLLAQTKVSHPYSYKAQEILAHANNAQLYYGNKRLTLEYCSALLCQSEAYWQLGDNEKAVTAAEEGVFIAEQLNNKTLEAKLMLVLCKIFVLWNYRLNAENYINRLMKLMPHLTDENEMFSALHCFAGYRSRRGYYAVAEKYSIEALQLYQSLMPTPLIVQTAYLFQILLVISLYYGLKEIDLQKIIRAEELSQGLLYEKMGKFVIDLLSDSANRIESMKFAEAWLRSNIKTVEIGAVPMLTCLMVDSLLDLGFNREALRWTAVGIKYAKAMKSQGWELEQAGRRSVAQARLGQFRQAKKNVEKVIPFIDDEYMAVNGRILWAQGVIKAGEGDIKPAKNFLAHSVNVFKKLEMPRLVGNINDDIAEIESSFGPIAY